MGLFTGWRERRKALASLDKRNKAHGSAAQDPDWGASVTLGQKQRVFAWAYAKLILKAIESGYAVTLGDTFRDPRVFGHMGSKNEGAYGRKNSLHKLKLAGDLNLFKEGVYLQETEDHRELGEWWEATFARYDAAWGGHFNDGNHYSFKHRGFR